MKTKSLITGVEIGNIVFHLDEACAALKITEDERSFAVAAVFAALTEAQNLQSPIWESLKTAISERNQLIAEVEALKQSIESGQRVLREDAEQNAKRAERAEAELAKERARLDWLETSDPDALHWWTVGEQNSILADIDAAMKEDAK